MSKRTQTIRSLFAAPDEPAPADTTPVPRTTSGAVRALQDTFSEAEREYSALREQLATGSVAIDLDPNLVDPSPFADRFEEQDADANASLKASIAENGQEMPILVREHPTATGRYQSAYGHRRVRATRSLGIKVKAYVRNLSNHEMVVAQGIENSARENLTFIERARFALTLEEGGFERSVIQSALSVDRAEVSKLIAVATAVPPDILKAIGRAPKVGRPRWIALAEYIADPKAAAKMRKVVQSDSFRAAHTNDRLSILLAAATKTATVSQDRRPSAIRATDGAEIARFTQTSKRALIEVNRDDGGEFADFLIGKIPDLYRSFKNERG